MSLTRRQTLSLALGLAACPTLLRAQGADASPPLLRGAGSTLAAPLYAAVGGVLGARHGFEIDYAPVGSGEGLRRVQAREVDFGAAEQALPRDTLERQGLVQLPVLVGAAVPCANLPGVPSGALRLDGALLADLMLGRVARWNDARIAQLNPRLSLPNLPVARVVRQDSSGTSLLVSRYLSRVSAEFARSPGPTTTLALPGALAARGNGGVARLLLDRPGALGYLEQGYAAENQLPVITLRNRFGEFVAPTPETITAAVRAADWEMLLIDARPTFDLDTVDGGSPRCWPVVGMSYVVAPTRWASPQRAAAFVRFMDAMYVESEELLRQERYVPLPPRARNLARATMRAQLRGSTGRA